MAGKIVNKLLGSRVREARDAEGLSQADLTAATKIGQSTIAEIEAGRIRRPKKLREIALALKTSEAWLLGETDDKSPIPTKFQYYGTDLVDAPLIFDVQPGMFRPIPNAADDAYALNTFVPRETRVPGALTSHVVRGVDESGLGLQDGDLVFAADFLGSRVKLEEPMLVVIGRSIDGTTSEFSVRKVVRKDSLLTLTLGAGSRYEDLMLMMPVDKQGRSKDQHGYTIKIWGIAVRLTREMKISKN
jgi:transcriptional regulator with XRE-family HTH domain